MSADVGVILIVALFVSGALLAARAGIRSIQSARKVSFFRIRRAHMLAGWQWLALSLFLFSFSVASALLGEPVANQLFPPTSGPTASPTSTPPPAATLIPSATYTDTSAETVTAEFTLTPTPTQTSSATSTPSQTATSTASLTSTLTPTATTTVTSPPTATISRTPSRTPSPTQNINAISSAATRTAQAGLAIAVLSHTPTVTKTATPSGTPSPTPTAIPSRTATPTSTRTPIPTATLEPTRTLRPTWTPSPTDTSRPTLTFTFTPTKTTTPTASFTPTVTLTPSSTATLTPSRTPTFTPTATAAPSRTPTRSPTPNRACDRIEVVMDVNVPANSVFAPGNPFTKVWRLKNVGTCTWKNSYRVLLVSGDLIGGQNSMPLPKEVAPGQTIDLAMNFTAPRIEGTYRGNWQLRNDKGEIFNMAATTNRPFSVSISVKAPPLTGTVYDFVSNACSAQWSSGAGTLTCPGINRDSKGFVLRQSLSRLENGTTLAKPSLLTVPQSTLHGYIQGIYPFFKVQKGDRFRAILNCELGATTCRVLFRLDYQLKDGILHELWTVDEHYEGKTSTVDLDLSTLAGQDVKFVLTVLSIGTASGDRAAWVEPRIARSGTVPFVTLTPTP